MAIGVQITGIAASGSNVADTGGTTFRALKVSSRPIEYGALGSYRKSLLSGTIAAGAGAGDIWQMRWISDAAFGVATRVQLDGLSGSATAFTAGTFGLSLSTFFNWTSDGSGGTSGTLTGNNAKLRTSMATSILGSMRIASTAVLTTGGRFPTADIVGVWTCPVAAAANTNYMVPPVPLVPDDVGHGMMPIVLGVNQGLAIRIVTAGPTGTWQFGVTCNWTEVTTY